MSLWPSLLKTLESLLELIELSQKSRDGTGPFTWTRLQRPQSQTRVCQQSLPALPIGLPPGPVELLAFLSPELVTSQDVGEGRAVLLRDPSQGHKATHRGLSGNDPLAQLLLHSVRQLTDQGQTPRNPARALVHTSGQLVEAQVLLVTQLGQQPRLLQSRQALGAALSAIQQQGLRLLQVQHHGTDLVLSQTAQSPQTLEAVDDQVALERLQRNHHNGDLLAGLGQRGEQPTLLRPSAQAQPFMAAVQLVKFQIHREGSWRNAEGSPALGAKAMQSSIGSPRSGLDGPGPLPDR